MDGSAEVPGRSSRGLRARLCRATCNGRASQRGGGGERPVQLRAGRGAVVVVPVVALVATFDALPRAPCWPHAT